MENPTVIYWKRRRVLSNCSGISGKKGSGGSAGADKSGPSLRKNLLFGLIAAVTAFFPVQSATAAVYSYTDSIGARVEAEESLAIFGNEIVVEGEYYFTPDSSTCDNKVQVNYGSAKADPDHIFGGLSIGIGNVHGNEVEVINDNDCETVNIHGGFAFYGDAYGNELMIGASASANGAMGGSAYLGNAHGNILTFRGIFADFLCGGCVGSRGNAYENEVIISADDDSTIEKVHGGRTFWGDACSNVVSVFGGTISEEIHGGEVMNDGNAHGNSVKIFASSDECDVTIFGGSVAGMGDAYGNVVGVVGENDDGDLFSVGAIQTSVGDIHGGYANSGDAYGNNVYFSGGSGGNFYGGTSMANGCIGNAYNNRVKVFSGEVGDVHGGYCAGSGNVYGNGVEISGSDTEVGSVFGGYVQLVCREIEYEDEDGDIEEVEDEVPAAPAGVASGKYEVIGGFGDASGNFVSFSGAHSADVFGGKTSFGDSCGNVVSISSGEISDSVIGGCSFKGHSCNNVVNISGDSTSVAYCIVGGCVDLWLPDEPTVYDDGTEFSYGTYWDYEDRGGIGNACGNSVNFSGQWCSEIYGGYTFFGNASGNAVTISGGGIDYVYGGYTERGDADGNTVNLSNCSVRAAGGGLTDIWGNARNNVVHVKDSSVWGQGVWGGSAEFGIVKGNSVCIENSYVSGSIVGGEAVDARSHVCNNSVTIAGTSDISSATLLGWSSLSGGTLAMHGGNALHLKGWRGSVASIQNFEILRFTLPRGIENGETIATVATPGPLKVVVSDCGLILQDDFLVEIAIDATPKLVGNDEICLIDASECVSGDYVVADFANDDDQTTCRYGCSNYTFDLSERSNCLYAKLTNVELVRSYLHGVAARTNVINSSGDHISGLIENWQFEEDFLVANKKFSWFISAFGEKMHAKTTPAVTNRRGLFVLGGALEGVTATGQLVAGLATEWGLDRYSVIDDYGGGDGKIIHAGLNLFAMHQCAGGVMASVAARFGAGKIEDDDGIGGGYENRSAYCGTRVAIGYDLRVSPKGTVEGLTKLLWNRQFDKNLLSRAGEDLRFDAVNSLRTQLCLRYVHSTPEGSNLFAGIAWEREFDGKISGGVGAIHYGGDHLERKDSALFELGLEVKTAERWVLQCGAQGSIGARDGVSASLKFCKSF
ncbi:MAG: hypothetical protein LBS68_01645 [Puniceicoccales bacterium]|nr:hypothetical protein [Puniceicoccales bacterium]